jgi:hypothetical protein
VKTPGKQNPKPRDPTKIAPSHEERAAIEKAFFDGVPIVSAILGQALLEHELETRLRRKFKRKDDQTWDRLTGESGPLNTFAQKITAGYAFGFFDDITRKNLLTVKQIRNKFAHSKIIIDFSHPFIVNEIRHISQPEKKFKNRIRDLNHAREYLKVNDPRNAFISLCMAIYIELMGGSIKSMRMSTMNYDRRIKKLMKHNPLAAALFATREAGSLNAPQTPMGILPNDPKAQALGLWNLLQAPVPTKEPEEGT